MWGLAEGIVGAVLGVDRRRDDEGGRVGRRVLVATWCPSTGRPGIGGGHPDRLVHRRWEITDGAVVLVGGKSACHVDSVEQPLTGRDLSKCRRRCVTICVDPEGGPVVQEEMVEHERLQDRDAAASLDVEQRDAVVELWQQHLVRSRIGLVSEGPIAVSSPSWLVHR